MRDLVQCITKYVLYFSIQTTDNHSNYDFNLNALSGQVETEDDPESRLL